MVYSESQPRDELGSGKEHIAQHLTRYGVWSTQHPSRNCRVPSGADGIQQVSENAATEEKFGTFTKSLTNIEGLFNPLLNFGHLCNWSLLAIGKPSLSCTDVDTSCQLYAGAIFRQVYSLSMPKLDKSGYPTILLISINAIDSEKCTLSHHRLIVRISKLAASPGQVVRAHNP